MSLEVRIDDDVRSAFPRHSTALLRVTGDAALRPIDGASRTLAQQFNDDAASAATLATAYWRTVFSSMGAKPKYCSSVEKLAGMQHAAGGSLRVPLDLVEMYCWFSLVYGVPMAGYRPARIAGVLRLTMPGAGVPFVALGQSRGSTERTKPGEVAYVDDEKAICRYWNYRDCDQTKLVAGVDDAVFVFDLVEVSGLCGAGMASDLLERFTSLLDGKPRCTTAVITSAHPQATLD